MSGEEKTIIEKAEEELTRFKALPPAHAKEIETRIRYLLKKIQTSQQKIESYEVEIGNVKDILKSEA